MRIVVAALLLTCVACAPASREGEGEGEGEDPPVPLGGACHATTDCQAELECASDLTPGGDYSKTVCQARGAFRDVCVPGPADADLCTDDLECACGGQTPGGCDLSICQDPAPRPLGEYCVADEDCASGRCFVLGFSGGPGCVANDCPIPGAATGCPDGQLCGELDCGRVCVTPIGEGGGCAFSDENICGYSYPCAAGLACVPDASLLYGTCETP